MISNIKIKNINEEISSIIIDEPKTYNSLSFKKEKKLELEIPGNRWKDRE